MVNVMALLMEHPVGVSSRIVERPGKRPVEVWPRKKGAFFKPRFQGGRPVALISNGNPFAETRTEMQMIDGKLQRVHYTKILRVPGVMQGDAEGNRTPGMRDTLKAELGEPGSDGHRHALEVLNLFNQTKKIWLNYFPKEERQPLTMFRKGFDASPENKGVGYHVIVAHTDEGKILGFSSMSHAVVRDEKTGQLRSSGGLGEYIVVNPEVQKSGVGGKLLEYRKQAVANENGHHLFVESEPFGIEEARRHVELSTKYGQYMQDRDFAHESKLKARQDFLGGKNRLSAMEQQERDELEELKNYHDRLKRFQIFSQKGVLVDPNVIHRHVLAETANPEAFENALRAFARQKAKSLNTTARTKLLGIVKRQPIERLMAELHRHGHLESFVNRPEVQEHLGIPLWLMHYQVGAQKVPLTMEHVHDFQGAILNRDIYARPEFAPIISTLNRLFGPKKLTLSSPFQLAQQRLTEARAEVRRAA